MSTNDWANVTFKRKINPSGGVNLSVGQAVRISALAGPTGGKNTNTVFGIITLQADTTISSTTSNQAGTSVSKCGPMLKYGCYGNNHWNTVSFSTTDKYTYILGYDASADPFKDTNTNSNNIYFFVSSTNAGWVGLGFGPYDNTHEIVKVDAAGTPAWNVSSDTLANFTNVANKKSEYTVTGNTNSGS